MALPHVFAGRRRALLLRLLANGLTQAVLVFAIALGVRDALRGAEAGLPFFPWLHGAALAGAGLLLLALRAGERADAERTGQDFVTATRVRLFRRIARLPARSEGEERLGLTLTRLTTDLSSLKNWVSQGVARSWVAGVVVPGGIAALAWFSWAGAAVGLGLFLLCGLAGVVLAPRMRRHVREVRKLRGRLAGHMGERVRTAETARQFGRVEEELARIRTRSRRLADALVRRVRLAAALRALPDAGFPLGVVALVVLGHAEPREDLLACVLLIGLLNAKLRDGVRALDHRLAFAEAKRRIEWLLSRPPLREVREPVELEGQGGVGLAFEDVSVGDSLERVRLAAGAGERVFVTGPSGSGKSTLLALAARRLDPDRGRVLLDGQRVRRASLSSLRESVHLVSPQVPLLRGTVASNLAYAARGQQPGVVALVAEFCGIEADALETRVGEAGREIPDGLRARLALARALLGRPRLLLVDDPAFHGDPEAREVLQRVLESVEATVVWAVPDHASTQGADRVWRLEEGRATELPIGPTAKASGSG